MVSIKKTELKSEGSSCALLEKEQTVIVPGITYGNASKGFVSVAFTKNEAVVREGLTRIKRFVDSL